MSTSLKEVDYKKNNFHLLRLIASSLVVFGHSYSLLDKTEPLSHITGKISSGTLGLYIFFIISGFLITRSWYEGQNILGFFKKRVLRIFPALFGAVIFSALIIGPIVTSLSLKEYFVNSLTWDYLRNVFMQTRLNLPGVFMDNPTTDAVNGSLWSLPIEFWMYILIAVLGITKFLNRRWVPVAILVGFIFLDWQILTKPQYQNMTILFMSASNISKLVIFFIIGSLCYVYRENVYLNIKIALLLVIIQIISFRTNYFDLLILISLPYTLLTFAFLIKMKFVERMEKIGDFSYGMYVYAFPIQQTILFFLAPKIKVSVFFLLSYLVTLLLAATSWFFIEKPALRYKKIKISLNYFHLNNKKVEI